MFRIPTKYLLMANGLIWMAVGIKVSLTGIDFYLGLERLRWWYFLLSAIVFAGFWFMFAGVVKSYSGRILSIPEPNTSIFRTFSVKGYLIIAFMITLGIVLKSIPLIPSPPAALF